jgi:hypothetical protein
MKPVDILASIALAYIAITVLGFIVLALTGQPM